MAKIRGQKNPFPSKPTNTSKPFVKSQGKPDQHAGLLSYATRPHGNPERPKVPKDKPRRTLHHYGDKRSGK